MTVKIAPEVEFYNPAVNDYNIHLDPRCLFGWGPPAKGCRHMFGHMCCREFGHPGLCDDTCKGDTPLPCERVHRPKNWDVEGRYAEEFSDNTLDGPETGL